MIRRLGLVLIVVLVGLGAISVLRLEPAVTQPIAFNHLLHIEEVGAECVDCHQHVFSGAIATIPNIEVCADCHDEAQTESAEEQKLVEYIQQGTPVPWRKVYHVPSHVYFSHRRHTTLAKIECDTCHGPVGQRTEPVVRPAVRHTMDWCIDCHEDSGVTKDCVWCHE